MRTIAASERGRDNQIKGVEFEHDVAELYRLLHYRVQHGRIFSGRQVDLFIVRKVGDVTLYRAIECKRGTVAARDIDAFLAKLQLVKKHYPPAHGTIVSASDFTDSATAHAAAIGIQLTLYRDLQADLFDGESYAHALKIECEQNELYSLQLYIEPTIIEKPRENPLPVRIDLRNVDRQFTFEGLILSHLAHNGLGDVTLDIFRHALSSGRIVLILDGFDEMSARITPEITSRNFYELAKAATGKAKIMLTCRTHYFRSRSEEEEEILGTSDQYGSESAREIYWDIVSRRGFEIAYLRSFDMH